MSQYLLLLFYLSTIFGNVSSYPALDAPKQDYGNERIFYMSELKEKEGIASLKENADKIDIIAPQFYGVSAGLNLTGGLSKNLQKAIRENNLKVMPLVANYRFRQDIMHSLLTSPKAQERIINSLVREAKNEKYIGWQFDFENISYKDKDLYSAFIEKTAEDFHNSGLILSVAVVSRTVDYEDTDMYKNWSGVFDYKRIADAVDFISLMTYDDPRSIGPVASTPFVDQVLEYVKDKIPERKISFGIPLYNWGWSTEPFEKITASGTYDGLLYIKSKHDYKEGFDKNLGAAWLTYFWEDKEYQVWYQDKQTFQIKLDTIKENNFRGFSAWVLGVEDPEIWDLLNKN